MDFKNDFMKTFNSGAVIDRPPTLGQIPKDPSQKVGKTKDPNVLLSIRGNLQLSRSSSCLIVIYRSQNI